jgi:hypothetical protein
MTKPTYCFRLFLFCLPLACMTFFMAACFPVPGAGDGNGDGDGDGDGGSPVADGGDNDGDGGSPVADGGDNDGDAGPSGVDGGDNDGDSGSLASLDAGMPNTDAGGGGPVVAEPTFIKSGVPELEWQGCLAGQSGPSCGTGAADNLSHGEAMTYCENLSWGGYEDWYFPNIDEFRTLITGCPATEPGGSCLVAHDCAADNSCGETYCAGCSDSAGPGVDGCYLPAGLGGGCDRQVLSATLLPMSGVFVLQFWAGAMDAEPDSVDENIRCVRSATMPADGGVPTDGGASDAGIVAPDAGGGGGTVSIGSLMWMKCAQGQTYNGATDSCDGNASTFYYCASEDDSCNGGAADGILDGNGNSQVWTTCNDLAFDGFSDWRVPTKNELKTLIKCTDSTIPGDLNSCGTGNYTAPTIDDALFPNTPLSSFWTSSSNATGNTFAWRIGFEFGSVGIYLKSFSHHVRCVR